MNAMIKTIGNSKNQKYKILTKIAAALSMTSGIAGLVSSIFSKPYWNTFFFIMLVFLSLGYYFAYRYRGCS